MILEDLDGRDADAGKSLIDAIPARPAILEYKGNNAFRKAFKRASRAMVRDVRRAIKQNEYDWLAGKFAPNPSL